MKSLPGIGGWMVICRFFLEAHKTMIVYGHIACTFTGSLSHGYSRETSTSLTFSAGNGLVN